MGALPTHPELLDWLAVTFRDELGGSLKALHRLIVTSAAYRQSLRHRERRQASQIDTGNTLLWRQNRRKLEAEAVRDSVLAVSGKLDLTMGGPGWQDFVVKHPEHSPHYKYDLADPQDAEDLAPLDLSLHRAFADAAVHDLARLRGPLDARR